MTPTVNAVPKPQRIPKDQRTPNPLKPSYTRERIRDQEQTPTKKASPQEANDYRVAGNSLRTISAKRLKALEGKSLHSTFAPPRPGTLQRKRRIGERTITRLVSRSGRLKPTKPIDREGARRRRLRAADRKASAECTSLPCLCGCSLPAQWAHLQTRAILSTRHDPVYSVPACDYLHSWMDQGGGVQARVALRELAESLGRRLTPDDAYSLLSEAGYYTELAERRRQER